VNETDNNCSWTSRVHFSGWVRIWFNEKYDWNHDGDYHWLWFIPVSTAYGYMDGFTCWSDCYYTASGTYTGIGGATSSFNTLTTDYPTLVPNENMKAFGVDPIDAEKFIQ